MTVRRCIVTPAYAGGLPHRLRRCLRPRSLGLPVDWGNCGTGKKFRRVVVRRDGNDNTASNRHRRQPPLYTPQLPVRSNLNQHHLTRCE